MVKTGSKTMQKTVRISCPKSWNRGESADRQNQAITEERRHRERLEKSYSQAIEQEGRAIPMCEWKPSGARSTRTSPVRQIRKPLTFTTVPVVNPILSETAVKRGIDLDLGRGLLAGGDGRPDSNPRYQFVGTRSC
jgi:hypothetical protein